MSDLIPVRFLKDMAPYAVNEIAGFPEAKVLEMEKKGVAERYDPNAVAEEEVKEEEDETGEEGEEEGEEVQGETRAQRRRRLRAAKGG